MLALLDLGLFVLDPAAWTADRRRCTEPMAAMALHAGFLRRVPVRLLWSDVFLYGFPWNQPRCPPELFELCVLVTQLHDYLDGNRRLMKPGGDPGDAPTIEPDLLAPDCPRELREAWLGLLGAMVVGTEPLAVPTWARALLAGRREVRVVMGAAEDSAPLLLDDADWRAFIDRHHRPDLHGHRVAVLGGSRAPFERARQRLEAYGLDDCRRLPPAYEENRTKQETKLRLQSVELVIVCTNRMKHTDTDQLRGVRDELTCAIVMLDTDTDAQIEKAVLDHFRAENADAG